MLAKGLTIVIIGRAAAGILTLVAFAITARVSPITDIGAVVAMLSLAAFLSLAADLGTSASISREAAAGRMSITKAILKLNTTTTVLMGLLLAAGTATTALVLQTPWPLIALGVAIALEKNVETSSRLFLVTERRYAFVGNALLRRFILIIGATIGAFTLPGEHALWGYVLGYLFGSLAGVAHVRIGTRGYFANDVAPASLSQAWKVSQPFFIGNISAGAKDLDVFLVSTLSGAVAGAQYGAAARLYAPMQLVPTSVASVLLPHVTKNTDRARRTIAVMSLGALATLPPIMLVSSLWLAPIVVLILGTEYASSTPILAVMLLGIPAFFLSSPLGATLQAMGRERTVARVGVSFAALTVVGVTAVAGWMGAFAVAIVVQSLLYAKVVTLLVLLQRGRRS